MSCLFQSRNVFLAGSHRFTPINQSDFMRCRTLSRMKIVISIRDGNRDFNKVFEKSVSEISTCGIRSQNFGRYKKFIQLLFLLFIQFKKILLIRIFEKIIVNLFFQPCRALARLVISVPHLLTLKGI